MSFNSFEFAVFFTIVVTAYWLLTHRMQNVLLLAASYVFYAGWDWRFLSLVIISTCVDYVVALRIHAATLATARVLQIVLMFHLTCLGWMIFRGQSIAQVGTLLQTLATAWTPLGFDIIRPLIVFGGPLLIVESLQLATGTDDLHRLSLVPEWIRCVGYSVLFYLFAFHGAAAQSFIYFQF